jgi:hypothetical protein
MAQPDDAGLSILVVRSGGFTGIPQQWRVEPGADADDWIALVTACPWGAIGKDTASRDRFVWRIEARIPPRLRTASVPDRELVGPWRALVDRVQEAGVQEAGSRG